ncbi:MAG TPA: sigma-70 family RNA polymerase sigma factor [Solirubrobacterales bacterium]
MWNDRRLARRAARGDSDAFAAIFRRYQQDLYRYCVAILGDRQDAQDAVQNTMVKALQALPGEQREIELKPWLYRIAHNESIELQRRTRPSAPLAEEVPAPGASPEQLAADRRRLRDLLADIAELPERHRGALVMRELAGLDFEEIGVALDTSPGAARQVLYEARRGLQQMSEGREMECDAVIVLLSEQDGRVARRRDLRAHLRDCDECRRFEEAIRDRSATLAGIAPLPAVAAAAIAKGALSGAAGGGAAGASGGGAAGVAGGAAAKAASTGAILKSAAAIVAVVGVSAVAVDHGRLFHSGGSSASTPHRGAAAVGGPAADAPGADGASASSVPRRFLKPDGVEEVGLKAPVAMHAKPSAAVHRVVSAPESDPEAADTASSESGGPASTVVAPGRSEHVRPAHTVHPEHPAHPEHAGHPAHPSHPAHPANPVHTAHPAHPSHPEGASQAERPAHSEPSTPTAPAHGGGKMEADVGAPEHPEPAAPAAAAAEPAAAAEAAATSEPPAEPPGQAKK